MAHPERGGARRVARAAVGDQQGVPGEHRIEGGRQHRRIDPGQHRAERRPASVRRHENRHLLARETALLRLAAASARLAPQLARALPALQHVRLVRLHDALEHPRTAPRRRQKAVTPAERRARRHTAPLRRRLHRLTLRKRGAERQPALLVAPATPCSSPTPTGATRLSRQHSQSPTRPSTAAPVNVCAVPCTFRRSTLATARSRASCDASGALPPSISTATCGGFISSNSPTARPREPA